MENVFDAVVGTVDDGVAGFAKDRLAATEMNAPLAER